VLAPDAKSKQRDGKEGKPKSEVETLREELHALKAELAEMKKSKA
jgi:hypothetical protein